MARRGSNPGRNLTMWQAAVAALVLIGSSVIVIRYFRQKSYLAVGWFWYLVTLLPVIGLVQVGAQAMADRYTYIPLTGIFVIAAWSAADLSAKWRYKKQLLTFAGFLILAGLGVGTYLQVQHWKSSITLFGHAVG